MLFAEASRITTRPLGLSVEAKEAVFHPILPILNSTHLSKGTNDLVQNGTLLPMLFFGTVSHGLPLEDLDRELDI